MKKVTIGAEHYYGVVCEKFDEAKQAGCTEMVVSRSGMLRESAYLEGNDTSVVITPQRDSIFVEYTRTPEYAVRVATGITYTSSPIRVSAEPNKLNIALKDSLHPANQTAVLGLFQATRRLRPNTGKMDREALVAPRYDTNEEAHSIPKRMVDLAANLIRISSEYGGEYCEMFEDGMEHRAARLDNIRLDLLFEPVSLELSGECALTLTMPDGEFYRLETEDMELESDEFHVLIEQDTVTALVDPLVNTAELSIVTKPAVNKLKILLMEALPDPIGNGY